MVGREYAHECSSKEALKSDLVIWASPMKRNLVNRATYGEGSSIVVPTCAFASVSSQLQQAFSQNAPPTNSQVAPHSQEELHIAHTPLYLYHDACAHLGEGVAGGLLADSKYKSNLGENPNSLHQLPSFSLSLHANHFWRSVWVLQ